MKTGDLGELATFVAIAEAGSFRRAAARLDLTPSTLSHALRSLEQKLGVRLINRTTRTLSLTEAGHALLAQIGPAFASIETAVETLNDFRDHPAGTVKISTPRAVFTHIVLDKLDAFAERYPNVTLEIAADNGFVDIVKQGFDAGIRLGESLDRDMIAVRVTPDLRTAVVASPDYLSRIPPPRSPKDLHRHRCIGWRQRSSGSLYRWEFERNGKIVNVIVAGPLIVDDPESSIDAAIRGIGLAYTTDLYVADDLSTGRLVQVLQDWCPPYPGFFIYYPSRRQMPAALRALIEALRVG